MIKNLSVDSYFRRETNAASLAVFRFFFGLIMTYGIIRFWYNGWIEDLYLCSNIKLHFHYQYFEFVKVPSLFTYFLFALCGLSAFFVSIGFKYRVSIVLFFLSFTYIELMDKTPYLNHYYFVSLVSFILIWLPANCCYSLDAYMNKSISAKYIPTWNVDVLKLMLAIVYIYAGIAKLNADWLFDAMPLTLWLPTKADLPIIGFLFKEKWVHYFFSWSGAIYDLFIVFFLLWKRTRVLAFLAVVFFHVLTRILFPIGMFPFIMIASTLIFFNPKFHEALFDRSLKFFGVNPSHFKGEGHYRPTFWTRVGKPILIVFMFAQILLPLRSHLYSENVLWTERGYRFSWRVMLVEKTGYANFKIVDKDDNKQFYVQNSDFLTGLQEKHMATQPDFILEYAQFLGNHFGENGSKNIEVYVESYASLNGRRSQVFIKPDVNLLTTSYHDLCNNHIQPINEK